MIEQTIPVKPLSVNEAYTGRRFKTKAYQAYCKEVSFNLKPGLIKYEKVRIEVIWYLSNAAADCTNPIKLFEDILQAKYEFNDNRVYSVEMNKVIVPKGKEAIYFKIMNHEERC